MWARTVGNSRCDAAARPVPIGLALGWPAPRAKQGVVWASLRRQVVSVAALWLPRPLVHGNLALRSLWGGLGTVLRS